MKKNTIDINKLALDLKGRGFTHFDIDDEKFTDEVVWLLSLKYDLFNKLYEELVTLEDEDGTIDTEW